MVRRRFIRVSKGFLWALGAIAAAVVVVSLLVTQPILVFRGSPPSRRAEASRLKADVRELCTVFAPRDEAHPENLDKAAAYIREAFQSSGGRVTEQTYTIGKREYRNILASFGPEVGERVVVGAHYDTCGNQPGADDNASGVAGLMELARLLGEGQPPPVRVELAAYTLEEPPTFTSPNMGSARHAQGLKDAGDPVRAMVCLEMIGYFSDEPGSQVFPITALYALYPRRGNFAAVVGRMGDIRLVRSVKRAMRGSSDLPVRSINAPPFVPGIDLSDHRNFWAQGYPAVMVTDTAFFRNDRYHTKEDTPETLDYERMAKVVDGVHAAVRHLAGGN